MPRLTPLFFMFGLMLSGCAQQQVVLAPEAREAPPDESQVRSADTANVADAEVETALPAMALTDNLMFEFLVSEIAGQRGMMGVAKEGYLDLARKTRDPRIVRRATEIALYSGDQEAALELSQLWVELEPASARALQTRVVMLVAQGKVEEAAPYLEKMLQGAHPDSTFMQLPAFFSKTRDAKAAYKVVQGLAQKYPQLPEGRYALAHVALQAGLENEAMEALAQADSLKPGWEPAALLRAQLIAKSSRASALDFLKSFLDKYPEAQNVRLTYARMLVSANQVDKAHEQFVRLADELPNSDEIAMATGLLSLQMGKLDDAETYLSRALELGGDESGVVRYYLGQVAEERKDYELAARRYLAIGGGEYLIGSRTRLASMYARQGRLSEAQGVLRSIVPADDAQKVQIIQAEADLLREAKDHAAVFALLDAAVKERPDNVDLLYDRAMAAEKLNKLGMLEGDLRKVIALKPDYAHAYNALGYTLADRTDRLAEATELLNRAIALSPEDPFILDSLGWLYYRKGNLDKAREFLERAWRLRQDPEIAAHLGEVLWMKGSRDEASRLWQTSLKSHPQNEALIEILKKFRQ